MSTAVTIAFAIFMVMIWLLAGFAIAPFWFAPYPFFWAIIPLAVMWLTLAVPVTSTVRDAVLAARAEDETEGPND